MSELIALVRRISHLHFMATLLTDDPAMLEALVLTAETFIVVDRSEQLGTKQAIPLRFESTVVNRLRFFDFTEGPRPDFLR